MNLGIISGFIYCLWRGWLLNNALRTYKGDYLMILFELAAAILMILLLFMKSHIFPILVGVHLFASLVLGFIILILPVPKIKPDVLLENIVYDSWALVGFNSAVSLIAWTIYFNHGM